MSASGVAAPEGNGRIAITGANGFIGRAVARALEVHPDLTPVRCVRTITASEADSHNQSFAVGNIGSTTDWSDALEECEAVIHTAGRAHILRGDRDGSHTTFHAVNVEGTRRLAEQAVECGVRRFIFLSSVGVHGTETLGASWTEASPLRPANAYARSKCDAEEALKSVAAETGIEAVIIRPPLVYGPGDVPGNFGRLVRMVRTGVPLPLASIDNARSFVARGTLVDLLLTCLQHPAAANETFLVSDDDDQSTSDFVRAIAEGLGRPVRLWPLPQTLLANALGALGRRGMARQLCGSLQVDIAKVKSQLDWHPPTGFHAAMHASMKRA